MAETKQETVTTTIAANSEGRWISAFENMKDTVMIIDKNMLIQFINRVEHGFTKEQVVGQSIYYFIPADKTDYMKANLKELFKSGKPFEIEHYISGPDGKDAWYYGVYSPIISASGKIEEFMIITRNTTMMKWAEYNVLKAMVDGQEDERKRISAELHDGLGQNLSALNINLMHLEADLKKLKSPQVEKTYKNIRQLLNTAGAEVKSITHNLAPPLLVELGLMKALEEYCNGAEIDYGVKIGFKATNMNQPLDGSIKLAVYRIAQELIYNSIKYSGVKKISVVIGREDHTLSVSVTDKGKGFDTTKLSSGFGLQNIQTRAKMHRGEVIINSKPGKGTQVKVSIPLS